MGSNEQREVWEFMMCKGWEREPLGPGNQISEKGLQLDDAVISGPPTSLVLQLLANCKLEQTIARRVEIKKRKLKKNAFSKMYADKNRKRKQKRKQRGKWCVSSSFSRLLASHYPVLLTEEGVNWQIKNIVCKLISSLSPSQSYRKVDLKWGQYLTIV